MAPGQGCCRSANKACRPPKERRRLRVQTRRITSSHPPASWRWRSLSPAVCSILLCCFNGEAPAAGAAAGQSPRAPPPRQQSCPSSAGAAAAERSKAGLLSCQQLMRGQQKRRVVRNGAELICHTQQCRVHAVLMPCMVRAVSTNYSTGHPHHAREVHDLSVLIVDIRGVCSGRSSTAQMSAACQTVSTMRALVVL